MKGQWKTSLWNLVAVWESDSSHRDRALFLLTIPQLLASWWREIIVVGGGGVGNGIAIGGKWNDSRGGGGCLHWGSGPARSSVCRRGPALITACKSLPFSGNGLRATQSTISGGGTGDETMLSSQSEEEKSNPLVGSSSIVEIAERGGGGGCCWWWKKSFWRRSFSHFWLASSLSVMAWFKRCLRFKSCSSLFFSSSWTVILVCSSSRVVHKSECLSSSILCQKKKRNQNQNPISQYPERDKVKLGKRNEEIGENGYPWINESHLVLQDISPS